MNREYQNKQQPFQKDIIQAISQSPSRGRAEKPEISCKTLNALTQKFIGEKDWINKTFFGDRSVVRILGDWRPGKTTTAAARKRSKTNNTYKTILLTILKKLIQASSIMLHLKNINKKDEKNIN